MILNLLSNACSSFDISSSTFSNEPRKEGTGRVVWGNEFGIARSYTLESSYCGPNIGLLKGVQFQIDHLRKIGINFGQMVYELMNSEKKAAETENL